ncbi:MAG: cardiolipin synthase [Bacillota bacterium]|jgi:cardiolipin synthase
MHKIIKFLFSRLFIISFLIVLQIGIIALAFYNLNDNYVYFKWIMQFLSLFIALFILNRDTNPSTKLPWIIVVLVFPIIGAIFYLMFGSVRVSHFIKKRHNKLINDTAHYYPECDELIYKMLTMNSHIGKEAQYIKNAASMSVYQKTSTEYYPTGEDFFEALIRELKKAKKFIFLEYFIVQEGKMWDTILEILVEKAASGVEVRMMYDDLGSISTLPGDYKKKLENLGIKCTVFNPYRATVTVSLQNRDHRKITVIDGHTAFTGGCNLADEYINVFEKHGHWKDCAIMIKGPAVWNLTMLFLQSWNFFNHTDSNYYDYKRPDDKMPPIPNAKGFVQPYGDSPFNNELISEYVYMNFINTANRYLYIMTPYLVVDNEMVTALILAAKSGVDVRIMTPHVPDKWYVHLITQAYYHTLIKYGVRIFEYKPGFIHSKTVVSDDIQCIVGTINFDFRSLYHHFECGIFMYETDAVAQVKKDFLDTQTHCIEITAEDCRRVPLRTRILRGLLRFFAPLM